MIKKGHSFADPSQTLRRPFAEAQGYGSGLWLRASAQDSALFCHSEGLNAPKNLLSRPFGFASGSDDYSISLSFRLPIIV